MKKVIEFLELIWIGFANLFFNLWLSLYETLLFGGKLSWWKLRLQFFLNYFFSRVNWIVKRESTEFEYDEENFIYGETSCLAMKKILETLKFKKGDLFVDLGSGRGLACFYANFLYGLKTAGYELIPSFVRKARNIASNLKLTDVNFYQEDILEANISKAKIIFIAGTTFPLSFIGKMSRKLTEAKPGTIVLTLSYNLPDKYFNLYREMSLPFSWGTSTVFFHIRRNKKVGEKGNKHVVEKI
ncbi:MAG: class I SAM-dependent methyltransferase [Firmicutes bacterium]|nr:class I SAM-dependent methyltransferase [Bacillota bacterium]